MTRRVLTTVLCLIGCLACQLLPDPASDPYSDESLTAQGLMGIPTDVGNVYFDPTRPPDAYDAALVQQVEIDRPSGISQSQIELARDVVLERQRDRITRLEQSEFAQGSQIPEPGPCAFRLSYRVTDVDLVRSPGTGSNISIVESFGSATLITEFRDYETNALIQVLKQRSDLPGGRGGGSSRTEFRRLADAITTMMARSSETMRDVVPLGASDLRSQYGCKGLVGEFRRALREAQKQPS